MEATLEPDDLTLASDAAAGDSAAFACLFHRHYRMIHSLAYRLSLDVTLAEDIAQEAFVKAARSLGGLQPGSSFKTWLCRIAFNTSTDALRRRQRSGRLAEAWAQHVSTDGMGPPADYSHVTHVLAALSEELRQAVALVFYEGLSHREAANILGCAETTVSWRLFRARRQLKKLLTKPNAV